MAEHVGIKQDRRPVAANNEAKPVILVVERVDVPQAGVYRVVVGEDAPDKAAVVFTSPREFAFQKE